MDRYIVEIVHIFLYTILERTKSTVEMLIVNSRNDF